MCVPYILRNTHTLSQSLINDAKTRKKKHFSTEATDGDDKMNTWNFQRASCEHWTFQNYYYYFFVFIRKKWKCLRGEDMNFWCTEYRDESSVVRSHKDNKRRRRRIWNENEREGERTENEWIDALVLRSCICSHSHICFFSLLSSLHSSLLPPSSSSSSQLLLLLLRLLPFFSSFHFIWVTKLINTLKY